MRASSSSERADRFGRFRRHAAGWLAAAALAGPLAAPLAAAGDPALRLRAVELEADLAKKPALYLVLDPAEKKLQVRVRGTVLTEAKIAEIDQLLFAGLFGKGKAPALNAPAIWSIVQGTGDTDRETIAPTTLRPYSEDDEDAPSSPTSTKPKTDADKPSSYRVQLDVGWQIFLVNEPPRLDGLRRFGAAVRDGWMRVQGLEPAHPPLLTLVVAPEDAQRLHHLFRSGMSILVLPAA